MRYFVLSPEVAGGLGRNTVMSREQHPPIVSRLHYEIDVWLGDQLLEAFPCFIVTAQLAQAINVAGLSGVQFSDVEITTSDQFRELYQDRPLPAFVWLQVFGTLGTDDFTVDQLGHLVVSEQALRLLEATRLKHCGVIEFQ